jgi:hypothetical protein
MYVQAIVLTLKNALNINLELVLSLTRLPLGPSAARRFKAISRSGSVSILVVEMSLGNTHIMTLEARNSIKKDDDGDGSRQDNGLLTFRKRSSSTLRPLYSATGRPNELSARIEEMEKEENLRKMVRQDLTLPMLPTDSKPDDNKPPTDKVFLTSAAVECSYASSTHRLGPIRRRSA